MLSFRKATSKSLKVGKLSVTQATLNFQQLFVMNFDSKLSWLEIKMLLLKEFITKNRKVGKNASFCVK